MKEVQYLYDDFYDTLIIKLSNEENPLWEQIFDGIPYEIDWIIEEYNDSKPLKKVTLAGGGNNPLQVKFIIQFIKNNYPHLKITWMYAGELGINQEHY